MARRHSPQEQFRQAKTITEQHGLFVVEKAGMFQAFRRMITRSVFLGQRGTPDGLHRLVCKITNFS